MRVAVTGAAGFVGVNLLQQLLRQGHEVRAIDRTRSEQVDGPGLSWVHADVLDPTAMQRALEGVEIVYHLVAKITLSAEDQVAWTLNTQGVRSVAEAALAAGVRRMVHCSSIHAYDQYRCGGRINENSLRSTDPSIPVYDRSKYAGELELRKVIDAGLDAVICNPTGIYGPADYGPSRVNGLLRSGALGRIPVMVSGGFDFVDVRDVVAGLIAAGERGRCGQNYLLGGHQLTMIEALRMAAAVVGRRGPLFAIPLDMIRPIVPIAERIGRRVGSDVISEGSIAAAAAAPLVDHGKASAELGYSARPAAETIRDLIAFFVSSGGLQRAA